MKTKLFIIASFLLLLNASCKNKEENKEATDKETTTAAPVKQNFSVEVDVAASKKDDVTLYYTEDNTINFNEEMAVWHGVEGNNKKETVVFDLSEEKIPTDIRLDFGINKEQEVVSLYGVKILYYGNELYIKGADFFKFFIESKDFKTEFGGDGSLKFLKNGPEYKTPFYYPRQELIDALKKLTTTKN